MSAEPEPGGASLRRDNGLVAESWSALAALDPAASADVLAALAGHGVAGLVESRRPSEAGDRAPAGPPPPGGLRHDLLWVDAGRRAEAHALLAARFAHHVTVLPDEPSDLDQPGPAAPPGTGQDDPAAERRERVARPGREGPLDEDAAWAQIIAGWDREQAAGPVPPWPVNEDLPGSTPGDPPPRSSLVRPARPSGPPPSGSPSPDPLPPGPGPRDHVPTDRPDDHYVPPPPPPLPRLRRNTLAALAVLALGVLLLFAPGVLGLGSGDGVAVTGIVCIVGSVVALVHGMRDRGSGGDGWDDGAVV